MTNLLTRLRNRRTETGDQGFTLVELLVVVVIIGILIAIAIPVYLNYTKSAKDKSAQSDLRNAISVIETCAADNNNTYPAAMTQTGGAGNDGSFGTACTQVVKTSAGTSITYSVNSGSTTGYTAHTSNSGGVPKFYCYNSTNGGSVATAASMTAAC